MKLSRHQAQVDVQVARVASLGEPVRRRLYRFVTGQPAPVSREQAAAGVAVAHHIAKFHLDKLEEDGLLKVEYRRPAGRTGPGAGRPAKFYSRAEPDIAVSLPERHYDLAGRLMAEAITSSSASGAPAEQALRAAATSTGQRLGADVATAAGILPDQPAVVEAVCEVLEDNGYQPQAGSTLITLANCPFHSLAEDYTELVCAMNLALLDGLLDTAGHGILRAGLDPAPGRCCVTLKLSARSERSN